MEGILGSVLGAFGGTDGLISFALLLTIVLGGATAAKFLDKGKDGLTDRVVRLASYAVLAVKKLSDNGEYDGMAQAEKNEARKQEALFIITDGLAAEGIKANPALMAFAGFAIEAALKQLQGNTPAAPATPPTEAPIPPELAQ